MERGLRGNRIRLHGLKGGGMEDGGCCLLLPREIKGIPAEKRGGKGGREKEDLEVASPKKKEERRADVPPPPIYTSAILSPIPLNAIYIQNPLTWLRDEDGFFSSGKRNREKGKSRCGKKWGKRHGSSGISSCLQGPSLRLRQKKGEEKKAYFSPRKHASSPSRVSPEGPLLLPPHPKKGKKPLPLLPFFESGSINLSSFSLRFFP